MERQTNEGQHPSNVGTHTRLRERGVCGVCGYRNDLRRDGTLGRHAYTYERGQYVECRGTGLTQEQSRAEPGADAPRVDRVNVGTRSRL